MNVALILSGGSGVRLGSAVPKQYLSICGEMILITTLRVFYSHPQIDAVQIVAAPVWQGVIRGEQIGLPRSEVIFRGFSLPGETRQISILNGLRDIFAYAEADDVVLIHDAARPLVSEQLISDCLNMVKDHDGVMPVLPMNDTVYLSHDGKQVAGILKREHVVAGQAPEAFRFGKYLRANEALLPDQIYNIKGSTEPAVLAGMDITIIPGDPGNFKITMPADLDHYKRIQQEQRRLMCK